MIPAKTEYQNIITYTIKQYDEGFHIYDSTSKQIVQLTGHSNHQAMLKNPATGSKGLHQIPQPEAARGAGLW